jgi:hypothetical protein
MSRRNGPRFGWRDVIVLLLALGVGAIIVGILIQNHVSGR